jgi:preprotein translocase subunit YajC
VGATWPAGSADAQVQTIWVPSSTATTTGWMPQPVDPSMSVAPASGWVPAPVVPGYAPMPAPVQPMPVPTPVQPALMPAPIVGAPVRRRTTTARLVDGLLVIGLVVAAGGVGYAIGRQTAPATPSGGAGRDLSAFGGFGNGPTGQLPEDGTSSQGPAGQVAAPSGAPVIPESTTAPAIGDEPTPTEASQRPGGQQSGGFGPGGFGGGGLGGTVSAVDPTAISVTTANGRELQVSTTEMTTYHQQVAASSDIVAVGAPVRVIVPGSGRPGSFGGGTAATPAADAQASVATEVVLLAEAPAPATGGRGARLGGGLTGTVAAIDGASITITMADGRQTQVATDAATSWIQQTVVTRDAITPGVNVRFSIEGGFRGPGQGGPGQGQGQPPAAGQGDPFASLTVSDVEVVLPAA